MEEEEEEVEERRNRCSLAVKPNIHVTLPIFSNGKRCTSRMARRMAAGTSHAH